MADDETVIPPIDQGELARAGRSPRRRSGAVRLVRRVLWPFVRPYHLYLLERLRAVATVTSAFGGRIAALDGSIEGWRGEVATLKEDVGRWPGEIATLKEDIGRWPGEFDGLRTQVDGLKADFVRFVVLQAELRSELRSIANRTADSDERIDQISGRTDGLAQHLQAMANASSDRAGTDQLFLHSLDEGIFVLKTRDFVSQSAVREGHWDLHVLRAAEEAVARRPQSWAIDAGAHFGLISIPLARRFQKVISFEPNSFSASILRANVELNGFADRIEVRRQGVFSRHTQISLAPQEKQEIPLPLRADRSMDTASAENVAAYVFAEDGLGLYETEAVALDELSLENVGFIKIDTQGADGAVILGALETIKRCQPWLVFEWEEALSEQFGTTFEQVVAALETQEYSVARLKTHNDKQVDYLAVPNSEMHHAVKILP